MSRRRLTWNNRVADPYTMNQERQQPAHDKYLIGGPSEFAEDPHSPMPNDRALGRNEIGMPNLSEWNLTHKDAEEWNSGAPYDNERRASMSREAARDVYARLEKKAFQCVKIATALLPGASDALIEEQALDFMSLPDDVVIATVVRLAAEEDGEEEEEEYDEKEAGEDEEEEEDDEVVEAMLREMLAEADEHDEEEEHEEDAKEASEDAEIEAMIREMMDSGEADEDEDMDIVLDPTMDAVASDKNDEVLRDLFSNSGRSNTRQASQKPARKGVSTVGGRVKEATNRDGDSDLSKLWQSDPDISDIF
jgi:hypothetical protein